MGRGNWPAILTPSRSGTRPIPGRHWWGTSRRRWLTPRRRLPADELARSIGLPIAPPSQTGTTIGIVMPEMGDLSLREAASFLAEALLWYFWPKFLPTAGGRPSMEFRVLGSKVRKSPSRSRRFPPLDGYVAALADVKQFAGEIIEPWRRVAAVSRYSKRIGICSVRRFPYRSRRPVDTFVRFPRPISGPPDYSTPSHTSRCLRGPELSSSTSRRQKSEAMWSNTAASFLWTPRSIGSLRTASHLRTMIGSQTLSMIAPTSRSFAWH